MKEGAGDDLLSPLEDDPDDDSEAADAEGSTPLNEIEPEDTRSDVESSKSDTEAEIPYLLRRNRVKEGRDTVGFGLQQETQNLEDEVLRELKAELDIQKLPATDLREAAYIAGLQNTDQLKEILLEWGYEHR